MLFGRHIVELNATNNTLVRSYVWGLDLSWTMDGAGGVGGLAWVTLHTASGSASGTHFTCYDGNGNIVSLVSATTGDVTARYEYGPFGEPIRVSGSAASLNPFRFSTKRTENNTDLVLYEYRAYNPNLGRWLSRDPIEEYGGQNLYVVVMNSPLIIIDLYGLQITPGIARTDICITYSAIKVSFFDNWMPNGGDVSKDYTLWYEKRFPNTTYFVMTNFSSVLDALAKARICNGEGISKTQLPSVSINGYGTGERRIVGNTTEYKFGDKEQTPYEAALDLGNYNIRVLEWKTRHKTCESSNCKKGYKWTARVGVVDGLGINPRNLGIDERETSVFIWFCYYFCAESLLFGPERQVIVASWDLSGEGCCD
jgi:RHS repeat-associated protein